MVRQMGLEIRHLPIICFLIVALFDTLHSKTPLAFL
jgi:hypothetical protein